MAHYFTVPVYVPYNRIPLCPSLVCLSFSSRSQSTEGCLLIPSRRLRCRNPCLFRSASARCTVSASITLAHHLEAADRMARVLIWSVAHTTPYASKCRTRDVGSGLPALAKGRRISLASTCVPAVCRRCILQSLGVRRRSCCGRLSFLSGQRWKAEMKTRTGALQMCGGVWSVERTRGCADSRFRSGFVGEPGSIS